jgi:hypothetical protein
MSPNEPLVRMVALLSHSSCSEGKTQCAFINSHKASFSFTGTMPQSIQVILHFCLSRTLQSLRHLEFTPLGSLGDPSGTALLP